MAGPTLTYSTFFTSFIDNRSFEGYLSLSRHCNEGEQNGDDGFLVHIRFVLFVIRKYLFEFRFQFVYAVRHGNNGAVAVDEEQSTILSAVLTEHTELVIEVNEAGPGEGVTFDGLAHGIGGLEFVGKAEHVQATISVLVVDGDDVAGVADAGRAPRGPADDERQLVLVVFRGYRE